MSMVRTFIARDVLQAHFVRNLLAREGIVATVLGDNVAQITGGIPVRGIQPAVWVRAEDEQAAAAVVERFRSGAERMEAGRGAKWTCAHCGEVLEAQFTDCWNCGTPRGDAAPPEEEFDPAAAEHVSIDVPCVRCQYNLRGLPPGNRCPECGQPIVPSLLAHIDATRPEELELVEPRLRPAVERALAGIDYPADAIVFLLSAWPRALGKVQPSLGAAARVDALELCDALAELAVREMGSGDEAVVTLRKWGFKDCRDLGRALFVLIGRGLLEPTDRVREADFPASPVDALFGR